MARSRMVRGGDVRGSGSGTSGGGREAAAAAAAGSFMASIGSAPVFGAEPKVGAGPGAGTGTAGARGGWDADARAGPADWGTAWATCAAEFRAAA